MRPGGEISTRPLHFMWICDCSGSMSQDGKIQALNNAIRESLPEMQHVADENPHSEIFMRCAKFSLGADWHLPKTTPLRDFKWVDLVADPLQNSTNADIIFMIDTSGSMYDEIETVKRNCSSFADRIMKEGSNVRLGLIGFDIGGHRDLGFGKTYSVHNLSRYTIGVWPLTPPPDFQKNIQSLSLGLFGGAGCYLASNDTVDIFPHVVRAFSGPAENTKILVIISDEMGDTGGLSAIVSMLKAASITTYVMGVPGRGGAHESIAQLTDGKFWSITESKGAHEFGIILDSVAKTIAKEMTKKLSDGNISAGTDMGAALCLVAEQLKMPPMSERAFPPVLVLISDGQPTDDFDAGLKVMMAQPWGKKAVRIAIAIGQDADPEVLQKFIGNPELKPLMANNSEALVKYIKWVSTAVVKSASSPASKIKGSQSVSNVEIPQVPTISINAEEVW